MLYLWDCNMYIFVMYEKNKMVSDQTSFLFYYKTRPLWQNH